MSAIEYRPEIDGLRAIAVLSVFIFHLEPPWLPGGFVGVDVFFVISGFLITCIIHAECQANGFSMGKFYQRRVARLFPAFFTVALITVWIASKIQTSQDYSSAGANLAAATLSLANVKYMLQGSYFEVSMDAQPYLHYWSLSVEEQFYMFFPLLLYFLCRYFPRHVLPVVIGLFSVSFASCVIVTRINPTWAFFLLPTRGWELLAGCWLAIALHQRTSLGSPIWKSALSVVGLAAILVSLFIIAEGRSFPGYIALLPVVGTVGVIGYASSQNWVGRFLSIAPLVFIGKISYSLYLWHWPVFSFVDYRLYQSTSAVRMALKITITVVATLLCYYLIERRSRSFLNKPSHRRFAFTWLAIMVVISTALGIHINDRNYVNASAKDIATGGVELGDKQSNVKVVLMGDSHASQYGTLCRDLADELDFRLNVISIAAGDPLPNCLNAEGQNRRWVDSLNFIQHLRPKVVILVMRWETKIFDCPERLTAALDELAKYTDKVILITQPPVLPPTAKRAEVRRGVRPPFMEDDLHRSPRLAMNEFVKSLASDRVTVLDIDQFFHTETGEVPYWDNEGQLLYHDDDHLSSVGIDYIKSALREELHSDISAVNHAFPKKELERREPMR